MDFKRFGLGAAVGLIALVLWLTWLWQPERQVRLHTVGFLKAVEARKWSKVQSFLADSYSDRWGYDKEFVVAALEKAFQQFLFLSVEEKTTNSLASEGRASSYVKISGQGGPIAQYVMTKVNSLGEPFTFTWAQRSGKPWDWHLLKVDHPSLDPGAEPQF
jgi:hypothetical protein